MVEMCWEEDPSGCVTGDRENVGVMYVILWGWKDAETGLLGRQQENLSSGEIRFRAKGARNEPESHICLPPLGLFSPQ